MGYNYNSLSFEDVRVGQDLPVLHLPITVRSVVMAASASRDWQPQHHDRDYCQKANKQDMFMGVWWYMGILSRFLTDWAGPKATVSNISFKIRESIYPGDDARIEGKVTDLRVEGGKHIAEVEMLVSNQLGPVAPATGRIVLPSRA